MFITRSMLVKTKCRVLKASKGRKEQIKKFVKGNSSVICFVVFCVASCYSISVSSKNRIEKGLRCN